MSSSGMAHHLGAETLSAYLDEELQLSESEAARDHLSACLHCRQRLEGLRRVAAGLRGLERVSTPVLLEQSVQRHIALEGSKKGLLARLEESRQGRRRLSPHVVLGFSLVVALAAILFLFAQALERVAERPQLVIPSSGSVVLSEQRIDGDRFIYEQDLRRWRQLSAAEPGRSVVIGTDEASSVLASRPELRSMLERVMPGSGALVVIGGESVELRASDAEPASPDGAVDEGL